MRTHLQSRVSKLVIFSFLLSALIACGPSAAPVSQPKPEVVRYFGPSADETRMHSFETGVTYSAPHEIMDAIQVGMTTEEVSAILKADFRPDNGITFLHYTADTYLFIEFENGRVSARRRGHNGVDIGLREDSSPTK